MTESTFHDGFDLLLPSGMHEELTLAKMGVPVTDQLVYTNPDA